MGEGRRRAITIQDVARLSGVSTATVTRTFQNHPRVRPETRQRVLDAAERLGYRPDFFARALASGTSRTIGLLVPSMASAYWGQVAESVEERAAEHDFSLLLASSKGSVAREREMLKLFIDKRVDGVILAGLAGDPHVWPRGRDNEELPLVLLEWDAEVSWEFFEHSQTSPVTRQLRQMAEDRLTSGWAAHVSYNDFEGAAIIGRYLSSLGHTQIAMATGQPVRTSVQRLLGLRQVLEEAGHPVPRVVTGDATYEGGLAAGRKLLADDPRPTAVVCYNDIIAVGMVRAGHELGLRVPDDFSVVGYDDIEIARFLDPPLTTLRNPMRELGRMACDLIFAERSEEGQPVRRMLTGSLVERGSAGPPPVLSEAAEPVNGSSD